ncbi:hypothetical protein RRG08_032056 [Elysia crispata]|uniref:Uncharacterized protein n=1 Tax=Elysia crispata TaxID=231223 RepID=A0AAE1DGM9_9GAST|nr:hypothetical protein RRG08_032056 [Elysia crispata]
MERAQHIDRISLSITTGFCLRMQPVATGTSCFFNPFASHDKLIRSVPGTVPETTPLSSCPSNTAIAWLSRQKWRRNTLFLMPVSSGVPLHSQCLLSA